MSFPLAFLSLLLELAVGYPGRLFQAIGHPVTWIGLLISLQAQFIRPEYFPKTFTLYPQWPAQDPVRAAYVFAATMGLLLAPKLIGYLAMLTDGAARRGFGGAIGAFLSML